MSLWHKPTDQITFADVEAFCQQAPPPREGMRLDFKEAIPGHPERTLSAFANTLGGMIVLGVRGNNANEPEWPPPGMPDSPGISERLVQVAQDAVYPPLRLEYSPNLQNPHAAGTVLVVVRVAESPEAPHAVDQGRAIYERTDNVARRHQHAHVDRIAQLLRRRERFEAERVRTTPRGWSPSGGHPSSPSTRGATCAHPSGASNSTPLGTLPEVPPSSGYPEAPSFR